MTRSYSDANQHGSPMILYQILDRLADDAVIDVACIRWWSGSPMEANTDFVPQGIFVSR